MIYGMIMVSTKLPKKDTKPGNTAASSKNNVEQAVKCVKCHRIIGKGESCNKNLITGEITCHDCEEDLVLKDDNFLAIE